MPAASLAVESLVLFVAIPLAYRFSPWPIPALPCLWIAALYAYWQLCRDSTFPQARLWNATPLGSHLPAIAGIFLVAAAVLWLAVRIYAPSLLFSLVRTNPRLWALIMILYPVLSVYPQGLLYRSFLMHRYASFFPSHLALILASATAFAFMHLIFRNPIAVGLTFLGGLLFAWRYDATASLLTSSVEHALYGCWLFTLGLGNYFYHGRIRLQ
jgi:uncharacterized protein